MSRVILHSDCNNFYASVECLYNPALRGHPVVVGGSVEARHGIVLAKNDLAKSVGVKTGEALWQARQKCPQVIVVPPNFERYSRFSQLTRQIYLDYTSKVEPFGLDEAWLDISGEGVDGETAAHEIRERVKKELGITVSIGVSFNKVFAKLGSDLKKPDAVTVISEENYKEKIWHLPASELLYVGPATTKKLHSYGVETIGDLADASDYMLKSRLGKMGEVIKNFANGRDYAPVSEFDSLMTVKSIGNSTTAYRSLENINDVKMVFYTLAESVAARVREQGFLAATLGISVRGDDLQSFTRQCKLENPSNLAAEYAAAAMKLFERHYEWEQSIRSLGLSVTDFTHDDVGVQLVFGDNQRRRDREERLENTLDTLRGRFGNLSLQRAVLLQDRKLTGIDPQKNHTIHPVGYY